MLAGPSNQIRTLRAPHLQLVLLYLSLQRGNLVAHVAVYQKNESLCKDREYEGREQSVVSETSGMNSSNL